MSRATEPQRYGTIVVCGGGCYGGYYVRQLARARHAGALHVDRIVVVDRDPGCRVAQLITAIGSDDDAAMRLYGWSLRRAEESAAASETTADAYRSLPIAFIADSWVDFLTAWFAGAIRAPEAAAFDAVVPSPLMPNLLADWVASRLDVHRPHLRSERVVIAAPPVTPWSRVAADGSHYASFATWMCPINCTEPPRCPETRGPRDWTMPATVRLAAAQASALGVPYQVIALFHTTHRAYGVGMFDVGDAVAADRAIAAASTDDVVRVLVASVSHCHGALTELQSRG